jgi:hypothetical protein
MAGVSVPVSIPFRGDPSLWKLKANHWQTMFPRARLIGISGQSIGQIFLDMTQPSDQPPDRFKARLGEELKMIRFYLEPQKQQVESFNAGLRPHIVTAVSARRERLQKHEGLKNIFGISLKRKEVAPPIEPVKITRKLICPLPLPPKCGFA